MKSAFALAMLLSTACVSPEPPGPPEDPEQAELRQLVLAADAKPAPDVTNRFADSVEAAQLGQKFFFDPRFSGPLLDSANNGTSGTLGRAQETGKVACAGCHVPDRLAFADTRSPRQQLSLASGWTHRKAPSLLDVGQAKFLTWDGRRDTFFGQVFGPIENALEFNSSRLFVGQQIAKLYRTEYEALFGPMPSALQNYAELDAAHAGCTAMPTDPVHDVCVVPGADDAQVTQVVVNFGKAVEAYLRQLSCGRSRFDAWVDGQSDALSDDEQAGARLFIGKGACSSCHQGPYLTDQRFHRLAVPGGLVLFTGVDTSNDPGAASGFLELRASPLNSRGMFSDGDDGRLDTVPTQLDAVVGAFKTPSLRCVSRRHSFMHNAEFRSLEDVVRFFSDGPPGGGGEVSARHFSETEQAQLVAFLRALDGGGPRSELAQAPP